MSKEVFVVINPELGWDCVVGVFNCSTITEDELVHAFSNELYVISKMTVDSNLENFF